MSIESKQNLGLREFSILILENIPFILAIVSSLTLTSIIYSLLVTPIYQASTALTHSSTMTRSQSSSSSLEQVASFVQSGTGSTGGMSTEAKIAIERINSKDYFQRIYNNPILLSCLYTKCDLAKLNDSPAEDMEFLKPNFMPAYRKFRSMFTIFNNVDIVTFSFKHYSPETAFIFLNWLVQDSNNYIRDYDVSKANNTIKFLNSTLSQTKNLELQKLISALIQKEIQTLALSEKTEYFAFEIVDSVYLPEDRIFPKRSLIVLTTFFLSIFLSITILVLEKVFRIRAFFKDLEIKKRIFKKGHAA
jgi:capsular polysaccharide biosynthesis protein